MLFQATDLGKNIVVYVQEAGYHMDQYGPKKDNKPYLTKLPAVKFVKQLHKNFTKILLFINTDPNKFDNNI